MEEFIKYPKTPRLFREIIVTEKLDGTNAQIVVNEDGTVQAGSRNRWITLQMTTTGLPSGSTITQRSLQRFFNPADTLVSGGVTAFSGTTA